MARSSTTFRPKWNLGATTVIRVPSKLTGAVLRYARKLDGTDGSSQLQEPPPSYKTARDVELAKPVNVASVPQRSPFRYPGGKTWLVPYIRSWLGSKNCRTGILVEPFAGGAIVGLTCAFEQLAEHVVLVEQDGDVSSVWHAILGGQAKWLAERILTFDLSQENVSAVLQKQPLTQRERSFCTILRNRVQRGGIMAEGAGLVKYGENGQGLKSRWYPETLARRIENISEIRGRITFVEGDGFEVIRRYVDDDTVAFFVDPPYTLAARRLYPYWQVDHRALFALLSEAKGDVLLTYDNTQEIKSLAAEFGFATQPIAMKNTHHAKMTELLIGKDLSWLMPGATGRESVSQTAPATLGSRRSAPRQRDLMW